MMIFIRYFVSIGCTGDISIIGNRGSSGICERHRFKQLYIKDRSEMSQIEIRNMSRIDRGWVRII